VTSTLVDDDRWAELKAAAKSDHNALLLPGCQLPCYPRTSPRGLRHFAHRPGSTCADHAGESGIHMEAKAIIAGAAIAAGWDAEVEACGDGWIADVLAVRGQARVALEVQWSRQTLERYLERQAAYAAAGVRGVWFARHSPAPRYCRPGEWPTKDLPVFSLDGDFQVGTDVATRPLGEATGALLSGGMQFRTRLGRLGTRASVAVTLRQVPCWKCGQLSAVWTVEGEEVRGACGRSGPFCLTSTMWAVKRVEAAPRVANLAARLAREAGAVGAVMAFRRTRPVPEGYMAFTCGHCHAVFGDFPLRSLLMEVAYDDPLATGSVSLDSPAVLDDHPHWCWDRGDGKCPA